MCYSIECYRILYIYAIAQYNTPLIIYTYYYIHIYIYIYIYIYICVCVCLYDYSLPLRRP